MRKHTACFSASRGFAHGPCAEPLHTLKNSLPSTIMRGAKLARPSCLHISLHMHSVLGGRVAVPVQHAL